MKYDWLVVYQGGKKDGCTQLHSEEPSTKDTLGYTTAVRILGNPGQVSILIVRPWTVHSTAPSYL